MIHSLLLQKNFAAIKKDNMKKPFSETKVGTWLKEHKPELLAIVKDFIPAPFKGGLNLVKNLVAGSGLAPEKITEFNSIAHEQEIEIIRLHNEEMANARNREIEVTKTLGKKDNTLTILSYIGVVGPILILFYLLTFGFPKLDKEIALMIGTLIGYIFAEYKTIFNYFFGSSSGSKAKQDTIDTMMKKE